MNKRLTKDDIGSKVTYTPEGVVVELISIRAAGSHTPTQIARIRFCGHRRSYYAATDLTNLRRIS